MMIKYAKHTFRKFFCSSSAHFLLAAAFLLAPGAYAQKQKTYTNMFWAGYYSSIQISKRSAVNTDIQIRTREWASRWSQQLVRTGFQYMINNNGSASVGGAWFRHAQYEGDSIFYRKEWRPWQEIAYKTPIGKIEWGQRLRLEQRLMQQMAAGKLTNNYQCQSRLRYRFELQVPLPVKNVTTSLINEVMVHPGEIGTATFFDQNRTFVGVNFKASATTTLQWQVMKIFLHRNINLMEDQNVLRFNIHQQFKLKK